jgi:hypothetical protein
MRLGGKRPQMTRQLELPLENRGEAPTGKRSEEEPTAMHKNERSGARISTSRVSPGRSRNLNFSNRPVRTRMPGGVAGVPGVMIRGPYADQGVRQTLLLGYVQDGTQRGLCSGTRRFVDRN